MPREYFTGTASVTAGGTTVVGSGTVWTGGNVSIDDEFFIDGVEACVTAVVDATHLTITPWIGSTKSGANYTIRQNSSRRFDDIAIAEDAKAIVAATNQQGYVTPVPAGATVPDPSLGKDNDIAVQFETWKVWKKVSGAWVLQGSPTGLLPANALSEIAALSKQADARANIGLTLQSSATDATAGRVLTVGAFGAGAPIVVTNGNTRTNRPSGLYYMTGATTNLPSGAGDGYLTVKQLDNDNAIVEYQAYDTGDRWVRVEMAGTFYPWINVGISMTPDLAFRRGNVLGTVAQSSGVPTGALVQTGSNANGAYVRFADGTQFCWQNTTKSFAINTAYGSVYYGATTLTFPIAFTAAPAVTCNGQRSGQFGTASASSITATDFSLRIIDWVSRSSGSNEVGFIAAGRWF